MWHVAATSESVQVSSAECASSSSSAVYEPFCIQVPDYYADYRCLPSTATTLATEDRSSSCSSYHSPTATSDYGSEQEWTGEQQQQRLSGSLHSLRMDDLFDVDFDTECGSSSQQPRQAQQQLHHHLHHLQSLPEGSPADLPGPSTAAGARLLRPPLLHHQGSSEDSSIFDILDCLEDAPSCSSPSSLPSSSACHTSVAAPTHLVFLQQQTPYSRSSARDQHQTPSMDKPQMLPGSAAVVKQEPLSFFPTGAVPSSAPMQMSAAAAAAAYADFLPPYSQHSMFMGHTAHFGGCSAAAAAAAAAAELMPPPLGAASGAGAFNPSSFFYAAASTTSELHRRGSQGTTSSSSTTNSHAGTPSPHPTSPTYAQTAAASLPFRLGFGGNMDAQSCRLDLLPSSSMMSGMGGHSSAAAAAAGSAAAAAAGSAAAEDDADKLCAVCNDRAVCLHYGARTCEGCKGFFKRTVQKKARYMCAGDKNCPIDKRYRSRCQFCRFQKCLAVGMVKEIVRHGSLSGRRGRLSSKTRTTRSAEEPPSPPLPLLSLIARAFDSTLVKDARQTAQTQPKTHVPLNEMLDILDTEFRALQAFVRRIPLSAELPPADVARLLARAFWPAVVLKLCYRYALTGDECLLFENGARVHPGAIPEPFAGILNQAAAARPAFRALLDWEHSHFAALLALVVFNNANDACSIGLLEAASVIDQTQSTIVNALKDVCASQSSPPGAGGSSSSLLQQAASPSASPHHASRLSKIVSQVDRVDCFIQMGVDSLNVAVIQGVLLPPTLDCVRLHAVFSVPQGLGTLPTSTSASFGTLPTSTSASFGTLPTSTTLGMHVSVSATGAMVPTSFYL